MKKIIFNINNANTELLTINEQVVLFKDDGEYHYLKGLLHEDDDMPAIVKKDEKRWYKQGELHRDGDKPALELKNETCWYQNGKLHRFGNPARIVSTYYPTFLTYFIPPYFRYKILENFVQKEWFLNGVLNRGYLIDKDLLGNSFPLVEITFKWNGEFFKFEYFYTDKKISKIIGTESGKTIYFHYYKDGADHCEDGPAIYSKYDNETMYYYLGKEHRIDGPSYSSKSMESWKENGKWKDRGGLPNYKSYQNDYTEFVVYSSSVYDFNTKHCLNGPAVIRTYTDGKEIKEYWINGTELSPFEFGWRKFFKSW